MERILIWEIKVNLEDVLEDYYIDDALEIIFDYLKEA